MRRYGIISANRCATSGTSKARPLLSSTEARAEEKPDLRLGWLTRAEEEFRRAVEATPDDWDTKYDFELVTKLAAELRRQPRTPPNQLMQLLRPQPKPGAKPVKRVG